MSVTIVATLAIAAVAVLGCIGSVLLLAFRVGRLIGSTEQRLTNGESDRIRLWDELGKLLAWRDRHVEITHRGIK